MRVLILGASGLVGSAIFRQLVAQHCVFGTYCTSKCDDMDTTHLFSLDVKDQSQLQHILQQTYPDIIVSSLRGDFDAQLLLHKHIADYLVQRETGKLIFLSSANVFDKDDTKEHYESDKLMSCSDYGNFKINCEDMLTSILGDRLVIIRVPFIWGKTAPRYLKITQALVQGSPVPVWSNLIKNHTTDQQIALYVEWIIKNNKTGIFHVGSSDIVDYQSFVTRLVTALGYTAPPYDIENLPSPTCMAVVTEHSEIPDYLKLTTQNIIEYLVKNV